MLLLGALVGLCAATTVQADEAELTFGGDRYAAGQNVSVDAGVANDVFLAGYDVALGAAVGGDAHLAGFNVTVNAPVSGDLYAGGFNVTISQTVGGDVSAIGNNVALRTGETVSGNVRLVGETVTLGSPVSGTAIVTARTLTLDAPVTGDLTFYGRTLVFGGNARVDGMLSIHAPTEIAVPPGVAAADRVRFEQLVEPDYMGEAGKTAHSVVSGFWPAVWAAAAWWVVLVIVGSAFIALMPRGIRAMQVVSERRPFRKLGLGILAFGSTLGLVPVLALTLVGIILLPAALIAAFVACSLAYLAGVYFAGHRVASAFRTIDTNLKRLAVLAVSLIAAALVWTIPVLGWLATLGLVTFGFGVIAAVLMVRWSAADASRLGGFGATSGPPAAPTVA